VYRTGRFIGSQEAQQDAYVRTDELCCASLKNFPANQYIIMGGLLIRHKDFTCCFLESICAISHNHVLLIFEKSKSIN